MSVAKKLVKKTIDEKLLKTLVPLNALGADRLRELAEKAEIEHVSATRILFKRGDTDNKTYFLLSGELEVQLADSQTVSIKANTPAALHPLLDARPRPATATIKINSRLLIIDTGLLDILVNYDRHQTYEVNEIRAQDESDWLTRFLQSLSAMNIPIKNIEHLMRRMQEVLVRAGETVIRQTDTDSQHYYVVKEGRCVVTKQSAADKTALRIAELSAGIGFGEEALLAEQPRNANITMLTDGRLMLLSKADFTQLIADPALHYVSYAQAQHMVQAGAIWLDTRSHAEHNAKTIIGSINLPLPALRANVKELNTYGKYIAFCDNGNRAAAAGFLLRQMGFSAYVLSDGLRDVPTSAMGTTGGTPAHSISGSSVLPASAVHPYSETTRPLKPPPQDADTVGNIVQPAPANANSDAAYRAKAEQLSVQLAAERARMLERIIELEAKGAKAERALTEYQERARVLQAQVDEHSANLATRDTAVDSAQKELEKLSRTHTRGMEKLQYENMQLQARVATTAAEIEAVKNELERVVEHNRTAEEALQLAEREIARLQAEADAAQRHAEESLRRASEAETLQASLLKEVQRKIEAAELMRFEAEEQAQHLREAAELSRKRAEQEARKVAEAEAARAKAQSESERRERLTEDIRKKAEVEMTRLKKEADSARANADEARKKSQLADAARRRLELEMQTAQARAQSKPMEKPAVASTPAVENDLDDLERELAQLQKKLEAKKHAAVTRNQQIHQAAEKNSNVESGIVQNVYDMHQKTQKLPVFKPDQAAPNDVGKVRKSGWISDSILWETTIGLREDSEAEKFLDNEKGQRATASAAATAKRHDSNAKALSSGEIKSQEAKRSVFTARESAPTVQRHVDVSDRKSQRIGLIALVSAVVVAGGISAYVMLHKTSNPLPKVTTVIPVTPNAVLPGAPTDASETPAPAAVKPPVKEFNAGTKSPSSSTGSNGAITRLLPAAVTDPAAAKPKTEAAKLPPSKAMPVEKPLGATTVVAPQDAVKPGAIKSEPAPLQEAPLSESKPAALLQESPAPAHNAPMPTDSLAPAHSEAGEHAPSLKDPKRDDAEPPVPTFTDSPRIN